MRLGKKKKFFIKAFLIFLFMFFICSMTISYLYKTSNITTNDYLKLLLSDSYGDDFYKKIVEIINNNFNPLNMIETKEVNNKHFKLSNKVNISNPLVYIYSDNQNDNYKIEYNITPNVYLATYFLSEELNNNGISTIFENNNISEFIINNNISLEEGTKLFLNDKLNNYSSIKYTMNLGRSLSNKNTTIKINNVKYALISLYANKDNISLITKINSKLNEKYKGISKIYVDESYTSSIKVDFGGYENNMLEVLNSIKIFSKVFLEVI